MTKTLENLSIKAIEKAIIDSKSESFTPNQNYEIVIPKTGTGLLHCNYFDVNAIKKLFDHLYQDKNRFVPNDVEVDAFVFTRRLHSLSMFLKKMRDQLVGSSQTFAVLMESLRLNR